MYNGPFIEEHVKSPGEGRILFLWGEPQNTLGMVSRLGGWDHQSVTVNGAK